MGSREDMKRFYGQIPDTEAVGLMPPEEDTIYFCTPVGAEPAGRLGADGIHFILLPGDERIYCVDPSGMSAKYVLPVAEDFRTFLGYVLYCEDANPLSQISWMDEEGFRALVQEGREARWPGCEAYLGKKKTVLAAMREMFALVPQDPFARVKELQKNFDCAVLRFSDEYYDVLGLERE